MPICVICDQKVERWLPHPNRDSLGQFTRLVGSVGSDLEHHSCPSCRCNDRDRHLWLYLRAAGVVDQISKSRILHIAPEAHLEIRFKGLQPREYVLGDLMPQRPGLQKLNVEKLPFADQSFDLILCNHVLEHVENPDRALSELARCLAPEGALVAQTPYSPHLKWTFEMDSKVGPAFAKLFYGQEDHVRLFGADIASLFRAAGLQGALLPHAKVLPGIDAAEYGVNEREPFFLFMREPCPAYPS